MNLAKTRFYIFALLVITLCFGTIALAQDKSAKKSYEFCQNQDSWNGDKVSYNELRETTIPAASLIEVDGDRNGGIKVKGSNRSDVLVRACVRTWGTSEEAAKALARDIRISTSPVIRMENPSDEQGLSVSYEIHVPRNSNLKLTTLNGGIGINGVEGNLEFDAKNGGIHLSDVAGDVRGRTTNGGLHIALNGNSWKGSGLNVETTNGGVHLQMPETYAARIETGTVNGGFKSDIPALQVERKERSRAIRLNTELNGGGAPIRVITTNGGVHINSSAKQ